MTQRMPDESKGQFISVARSGPTLHTVADNGLEAVEVGTVLGLAKLATMQFRGEDIMPTYRGLAERLQQDQENVAPLMDVAILDQFLGWPQRGLTIQTAALGAQRIFRLANSACAPTLRLLGFAMAGPISANIPIEFLIEDSE